MLEKGPQTLKETSFHQVITNKDSEKILEELIGLELFLQLLFDEQNR
jgi:hypothetical protein